jgi:hypothetical protein
MGADGKDGCEHGAEAAPRPQPARSRRPGRAGLTPLTGRLAAPDFYFAQAMPGFFLCTRIPAALWP